MEEKEVKATKESDVKQEKLTYEQLENVAHQLSEQGKQLYNKLQEANMNNIFKRLDYLFKVIENNIMFAEEFVNTCVSEIESLISIPEKEEQETEEQESK